jgi:hypothetical protein
LGWSAVTCIDCGTQKVRTERNSSGTAPKRMKGRNLPKRVIVRSTARPAMRSAKASQMRTMKNIVPMAAADRPATSV